LKTALRNLLAANLLAVLAVSASGAGYAADLPSTKAPVEAPALPDDWIVTLSGQANVGPSYPGAKRYDFFGYPGISLRRASEPEIFSTPDDGFSFAFYNNSLFRVGAIGRLVGDRSAHHDHELAGLAYVPYSLELGGFAEVTPVSWGRLRVELRQAVTGHDGLVATVGGDVWQSWNRFTLSVGPRLYFGDDKYARTYFSVTPAQALVNGNLTAYNAAGGLTAAGGTVALRYDYNEFWRVTGFGNYQRLTGSVADSPLTTRVGTRDQYTAGIELAYRYKSTGFPILGSLF
jgi:outer membrane scaffolding protein for murein synthesis (MipA/OmpV family)